MKKLISIVAAAAVLITLLAACGSGGKQSGEVNVYNWGEYIDETVLEDFEKETGIKVNYTTYPNNESMYSVLKTGASNYDVIIPSDYMISRLISEDMLEKLDYSNIPNYSLIDDKYKKLEYDPTGEYSVAYMTGVTGIIYNSAMISDEISSWDALFNPQYAGQILMIDNPRDALAVALLDLGYSVNTTDPHELNQAYELLMNQKPLVQAYVNDQIYDKLESGEAAIGTYYAGDYLAMKENNPDLQFVVPVEGANRFEDGMCIPKGASNKKNAELFINFMCQTDICLRNVAVTYYTPVNKEAAEEYKEMIDAETAAITFPSDDVLGRCQIYLNLPADTLKLYDDLWIKLKS